MQIFNSKSSRVLLIHSLFIIAMILPGLSFAYYGGRHHGSYGYGHSRHYGYRSYGRHSYYPNNYYRRNYYSYSPSRRYQQYPRTYTVTLPANTKIYQESNVKQQSKAEYSGIDSTAWQILGQGQYSEALNVFAEEAQSHPNSGVPKVGYALAIAARGDLERGIWAMRRAFRIDPGSLHYLQLDEKSYFLVESLIGQYSSQKNNGSDDQGFMISALYYLKHDYTAAKKTIMDVPYNSNKSSSNKNLQRLINQQLTPGQKD